MNTKEHNSSTISYQNQSKKQMQLTQGSLLMSKKMNLSPIRIDNNEHSSDANYFMGEHMKMGTTANLSQGLKLHMLNQSQLEGSEQNFNLGMRHQKSTLVHDRGQKNIGVGSSFMHNTQYTTTNNADKLYMQESPVTHHKSLKSTIYGQKPQHQIGGAQGPGDNSDYNDKIHPGHPTAFGIGIFHMGAPQMRIVDNKNFNADMMGVRGPQFQANLIDINQSTFMMTKKKFGGVSPSSGQIAGWSNDSKHKIGFKQKSNKDLEHMGQLGSTQGANSKRSYKIQNVTNSNFYKENPGYLKNSRAISPTQYDNKNEKFQFGLIPVSKAIQQQQNFSAPRVGSDFEQVPTVDGQEFFPKVKIGAFQYQKRADNDQMGDNSRLNSSRENSPSQKILDKVTSEITTKNDKMLNNPCLFPTLSPVSYKPKEYTVGQLARDLGGNPRIKQKKFDFKPPAHPFANQDSPKSNPNLPVVLMNSDQISANQTRFTNRRNTDLQLKIPSEEFKDKQSSKFSIRHHSVSNHMSNNGLKPINYSHLNLNPIYDQPMGETQKNTKFNLYGKYGQKYRKGPKPNDSQATSRTIQNNQETFDDVGSIQKELSPMASYNSVIDRQRVAGGSETCRDMRRAPSMPIDAPYEVQPKFIRSKIDKQLLSDILSQTQLLGHQNIPFLSTIRTSELDNLNESAMSADRQVNLKFGYNKSKLPILGSHMIKGEETIQGSNVGSFGQIRELHILENEHSTFDDFTNDDIFKGSMNLFHQHSHLEPHRESHKAGMLHNTLSTTFINEKAQNYQIDSQDIGGTGFQGRSVRSYQSPGSNSKITSYNMNATNTGYMSPKYLSRLQNAMAQKDSSQLKDFDKIRLHNDRHLEQGQLPNKKIVRVLKQDIKMKEIEKSMGLAGSQVDCNQTRYDNLKLLQANNRGYLQSYKNLTDMPSIIRQRNREIRKREKERLEALKQKQQQKANVKERSPIPKLVQQNSQNSLLLNSTSPMRDQMARNASQEIIGINGSQSFSKLIDQPLKKNSQSRKHLIIEDPSNENKDSNVQPNIKQIIHHGHNSDQKKSPKALNKIMVEKTDTGQRRLDGQVSKQLVIKDSCKSIESIKISPRGNKQSPRDSKEPMLMIQHPNLYPYYKHLSPDTTKGKFKIESIIDNKFREQIEKFRKDEKVKIQIKQLQEDSAEKVRTVSGLGKWAPVELNTMNNFGTLSSLKPNLTGQVDVKILQSNAGPQKTMQQPVTAQTTGMSGLSSNKQIRLMNTLKIAENTDEEELDARAAQMSSTISKMSAGIKIKTNKLVIQQKQQQRSPSQVVVNKYSIQHRSPSQAEINQVKVLQDQLAARMNQYSLGQQKIKQLTAEQSKVQILKMRGKGGLLNHSQSSTQNINNTETIEGNQQFLLGQKYSNQGLLSQTALMVGNQSTPIYSNGNAVNTETKDYDSMNENTKKIDQNSSSKRQSPRPILLRDDSIQKNSGLLHASVKQLPRIISKQSIQQHITQSEKHGNERDGDIDMDQLNQSITRERENETQSFMDDDVDDSKSIGYHKSEKKIQMDLASPSNSLLAHDYDYQVKQSKQSFNKSPNLKGKNKKEKKKKVGKNQKDGSGTHELSLRMQNTDLNLDENDTTPGYLEINDLADEDMDQGSSVQNLLEPTYEGEEEEIMEQNDCDQ